MRVGFKASALLLSGVILAACGGGDKEQPQIGPISGYTGFVSNASFDPQIAVDGNGNAIAVWTLSNGTRRNVWANRYVAGSGWGTPQLIESDGGADSGLPQIVIRKSTGDAIVVWEKSDNTRRNIWANHYDAATQRWAVAQLLETDNAGFANAPHVAMDGSGNAMAVWEQSDGTRKNIWSNRYDATTRQWSGPVLVEGDSSDARSPQIAVSGNDSFVVVWGQMAARSNAVGQYDSVMNKRYNLWGNRYDVATQQWGVASLISDNSIISGDPNRNSVVSGNADDPHVAMDAEGNALAVWVQSTHVYASRYAAGSGWQAQIRIENDANWAVAVPRIAMTARGDALVVWEQYLDNDPHDNPPAWKNIWANRYVKDVGWQAAQLIENNDKGHALAPQIAFDGVDNALAVWRQWDGTRYSVFVNRFDVATGWGEVPVLIEADDAGDALSPQIAVDGTGNALAVWSQSDGVRTRIDANRYTVGDEWGSAGSIEGR